MILILIFEAVTQIHYIMQNCRTKVFVTWSIFSHSVIFYKLPASSSLKKCSKVLEETAQVTPWRGNARAAFASRTCHSSIALHSKEMDTWRAQSNSSLNYIVFQLKITVQTAECLSKMTLSVVYHGEKSSHSWKFVADTLHRSFIPPLHKGHTHTLMVLCSQLHMQVLGPTELMIIKQTSSKYYSNKYTDEVISWPLSNYINQLLH